MAQLIDPEVLEYAEAHTTAPSGAPGRRGRLGHGRSSPLGDDGRAARRAASSRCSSSPLGHPVLEIGTFTGYSAIAMAAGLPKGGSHHLLEVDPLHATVARGNIAEAGLERLHRA